MPGFSPFDRARQRPSTALGALLAVVLACQVRPPARPANVRPPAATCASDEDCVVFEDDVDGRYACCAGCTQRAANRVEHARFRRECAAQPPRICPPLGCAMPIVHAVCRSGRCELAPGPGPARHP